MEDSQCSILKVLLGSVGNSDCVQFIQLENLRISIRFFWLLFVVFFLIWEMVHPKIFNFAVVQQSL